ncbi:substrate-binding domain-containing protein [Carnobacterium iners]|uniref:substrate-binding domain-containing protein n=1 Tax=Carnobacterium iners TaxID=1073423 RepID=UPI0008D7F804|nr:substrate-binding domain-containing protein [Carnobacterium iners]SEK60360.1 substrate-binding protein domain-containing protein [Carnobacterium iners]
MSKFKKLLASAAVSTIKDVGIEVNEIGQQVANWDADKANTAWLSRGSDNVEVVLVNNDSMASGVTSALQSVGYNKGGDKHITVFGVDATDEAVDLIAKNYMSGTVKQVAVGMAEAICALELNATQGKDYIEGTDYECDDTGISILLPYQVYSRE